LKGRKKRRKERSDFIMGEKRKILRGEEKTKKSTSMHSKRRWTVGGRELRAS
jgi:hypothetical protein